YRIGKGEIILSQDFGTALSAIKINREELVDKGLKFTRRVNDSDTFYYVVNHSANNVNEFVKLKAKGNQVILMDPQNGEIGEADVNAGSVRIQIKSGQAFILKISKERSDIKKWNYLGREIQSTTIEKNWNLSFANGGPELPANRKLVTLKSWTAFG